MEEKIMVEGTRKTMYEYSEVLYVLLYIKLCRLAEGGCIHSHQLSLGPPLLSTLPPRVPAQHGGGQTEGRVRKEGGEGRERDKEKEGRGERERERKKEVL